MISGTDIAAARQRAGLSQKALANLLGTDVKTVNNWESGRTQPRQLEVVRQFLEAYPPESASPLTLVSDEELLKEIAERFARSREKGEASGGNNFTEKSLTAVPDLPKDDDFSGPEVGAANAAQDEAGPSVGQMKADQQDKDAEDEGK